MFALSVPATSLFFTSMFLVEGVDAKNPIENSSVLFAVCLSEDQKAIPPAMAVIIIFDMSPVS